MKALWINYLFQILPMVAVLSAKLGWACEIERFSKGNDIFFVSTTKSSPTTAKEFPVKPIHLSNCKNKIQVALSILSPSPQDYSSEYWMRDSLVSQRRCQMVSDVQSLNPFQLMDNSPVKRKYALFNACIGFQVKDLNGLEIKLDPSVNCEMTYDSTTKSAQLKGDNCILKLDKKTQDIQITPIVLPSCYQERDFIDINLNVKLISIENNLPEILGSKDVLIMFEDFSKSVSKIRTSSGTVNFLKSSQYQLDFNFFNLILVGSKDLEVKAKTQFFLNNFSNQNLPFVAKTNLMLVKKDKSELNLGNWYNGIMVPGKWQGVDGLTDHLNIMNSVEMFKLNNNVRSIENGDFIILRSELVSPNSGFKKFTTFIKDYLSRLSSGNISKPNHPNSSTNPTSPTRPTVTLKPIDELKGLSSLETIPEYSLDLFKNSPFRLESRYQVYFDQVCMPDIKDGCIELSSVEALPEIQVLFVVTESDYDIKLKPLKMIKLNWNKKTEENLLTKQSSIVCH